MFLNQFEDLYFECFHTLGLLIQWELKNTESERVRLGGR